MELPDDTTKEIPDETTEELPNDTTMGLPDTITEDHELLRSERLRIIAMGAIGYVYRCPGNFAYKQHAGQREFDLMKLAGDCSIKPVCRVVRLIQGVSVMDGMVMELATPFDFKAVSPQDRAMVKDEMIGLLSRLHDEYGIIHGDIKPSNFLRCRDGKLRLCDFEAARRIGGEDVEEWESGVSERYIAPNRGFPDRFPPPTVQDDWYALAISLWELYTGRDAMIDQDMEELLQEGKTVDVTAVQDDEVRAYICTFLRAGGARV